jgi:hypothetical protein
MRKIDSLLYKVQKEMDFLTELSEITELDKNAVLAFVHEEASKILNRWHMMAKNEEPKIANKLVQKFFNMFPNAYLSGGALVREDFSDYDLFLVGADHPNLSKIRQFATENKIAMNFHDAQEKPIQIIKKFYETPELIIANFDLNIVRYLYRPGYYRVSVLKLFEEKTGFIYVNMKNNSKNFLHRIKKYGTRDLTYFNVFDAKPPGNCKEKPYWEPAQRSVDTDVRRIIHGRAHKVIFRGGILESVEDLLRGLTPANYSFHAIFKTRDPIGRINVRGQVYTYRPENCKKIVEFLLRKYYPEYAENLKFTHIRGYVGPVAPLPPIYRQHSGINIFKVFPALLIIQKFRLPKFIRILITWYYTLAEILTSGRINPSTD